MQNLILIYADGTRQQAFLLLAYTEDKIRVAVPGGDDSLELTNVRATWASEDCEALRVEFAWQVERPAPVPAGRGLHTCPPERAAHLIRLLRLGHQCHGWNARGALGEREGLELATLYWREPGVPQ